MDIVYFAFSNGFHRIRVGEKHHLPQHPGTQGRALGVDQQLPGVKMAGCAQRVVVVNRSHCPCASS